MARRSAIAIARCRMASFLLEVLGRKPGVSGEELTAGVPPGSCGNSSICDGIARPEPALPPYSRSIAASLLEALIRQRVSAIELAMKLNFPPICGRDSFLAYFRFSRETSRHNANVPDYGAD